MEKLLSGLYNNAKSVIENNICTWSEEVKKWNVSSYFLHFVVALNLDFLAILSRAHHIDEDFW